jgi:hypothetical protein
VTGRASNPVEVGLRSSIFLVKVGLGDDIEATVSEAMEVFDEGCRVGELSAESTEGAPVSGSCPVR